MTVTSLRCLSVLASLCLSVTSVAGCSSDSDGVRDSYASSDSAPITLIPEIVAAYPFNQYTFTQGLEVDPDNEELLVSSGLWNTSFIARIDPSTGKQLSRQSLPGQYFAEGLTLTDRGIWQLTWRNGTAFLRDSENFTVIDSVPLPGEGWGLCNLGNGTLALSDGSATIKTVSQEDFSLIDEVSVHDSDHELEGLNELECTESGIWANVFQTTDIVLIDPKSGTVKARVDASSLPNNAVKDRNNVLNGIAAIPGTEGLQGENDYGEFYVTGKRWPDLYRVRFVSVPADSQ